MEESLDKLLETYKKTMKLGSHTSHGNEKGVVVTIRFKYPPKRIQAEGDHNSTQGEQKMDNAHPLIRPSLLAYRNVNSDTSNCFMMDTTELPRYENETHSTPDPKQISPESVKPESETSGLSEGDSLLTAEKSPAISHASVIAQQNTYQDTPLITLEQKPQNIPPVDNLQIYSKPLSVFSTPEMHYDTDTIESKTLVNLSSNDPLCSVCDALPPAGTKLKFCKECKWYICGACELSGTSPHNKQCTLENVTTKEPTKPPKHTHSFSQSSRLSRFRTGSSYRSNSRGRQFDDDFLDPQGSVTQSLPHTISQAYNVLHIPKVEHDFSMDCSITQVRSRARERLKALNNVKK